MVKKSNNSLFDKFWNLFISVKLAVILLILIAASSIIGTVIPQNASSQFYIHTYGNFWFNIFSVFNIVDMYHAWWFLCLLMLLCLNIVVCSIERLSLTWKIIFPKSIDFQADRYRKKKNIEKIIIHSDLQSAFQKCETLLSKSMKTVISRKTDSGMMLYAEKGRWTRIGVYIVHVSILFLLLGALLGASFGFKGNMQLNEGEAKDIVLMPKQQTALKLNFSIRCNRFGVKFYDSGMPEEFKSSLTIIENGQDVLTADILVNKPLRYKGINIFQSSYGTASPEVVTFSFESNSSGMVFDIIAKKGVPVPLPEGAGMFEYSEFIPNFNFNGHNLGDAFHCDITVTDQPPVHINIPMQFPTFDKMRKGKFIISVQDFEKKYYTGLQVTKDPGVWYVYIGFAFMILGCWTAFFLSHQIVFIELIPDKTDKTSVLIYGDSNKNKQNMKFKTTRIIEKLKGKI